MSRRRITRVLVAAVVMLVLASCRVDVELGIDVAGDGSGTVAVQVNLDQAAFEALGNLEQQLRLDDVRRAGWQIVIDGDGDGGDGDGDGGGDGRGAVITATKPVAAPDDWQRVLDEIAGPGVFTDVELVADGDRQRLSFDLDLSDGWALFADEELTAALDGEAFGAPIESLTDGRSIDDIIAVDIGVSVRNTGDDIPTVASFSPRFDDGRPFAVVVEASGENSTAVLLRWISIALFTLFALATVLAITGVVLQRRSDRLRPAPTPAPLASRLPGQAAAGGSSAAASGGASSQRSESVRLVVIEPLSVLYRQTRSLDDFVLPFIREQGGTARADTIETGYRSLLAGSKDTAGFWELCGVDGDADDLDEAFVGRRVLQPATRAFFDEMQRRRIPVSAVSDDASAWSARVRERDRLSAVWPWLVSADVGVVTSNIAMFEVLRRESSIAHSHCLYVDSDLASLDTAKELGMKTALFDAGNIELPAVVGHPVITDLKALFAGRGS